MRPDKQRSRVGRRPASALLAAVLALTLLTSSVAPVLAATPLAPPASDGNHTLNLHVATASHSGTTYKLMDTGAVAGSLGEASTAHDQPGGMPQSTEVALKYSATTNGGVFVSDPVPAGTVWDISGSWTFNPYIRMSSATRYWVRARVYRVTAAGTVTQVLYSQNGTRFDTNLTTYTLRSWSGSVTAGADTTLQPGDRMGVAFFVYTDRSDAPTGYVGFDASSAPSNVSARYRAGVVRQDHYRIGQNTALTSMAWYAAADTAATNIPRNTNFRVRFQLYNNGPVGRSWTPQLEWTATSGSGYAAVPTISGATPFFVTDTTHYTNGAAIATGNFGLGTGVGTAQAGVAYDTANPAGAGITLNANSYTEIEFNIQANNNAAEGSNYYFRLTTAGSALEAYEVTEAQITIAAPGNVREAHYRIGQDSALTGMTWYANTDTAATGIPQNTNFRVRFQVYNNGGANLNWTPQLEWSATQGSGHAAVPTTSGASPFFVTDTTEYANGASIATGNFGLGTGTGSAQAGTAYDSQNPAGAAITLNAGSYSEIEFNIQANANATPSTSYYFRLTNAGTALTSYDTSDAQITMQAAPGVTREAHYRVGQDSALSTMTWYANTDTAATDIPQATNFRVRFQVYNDGGQNTSWTPQLEWSATQGSGHAAVPTTSGSAPFFVSDTTQYANGASIATGNFGLGTGTGSAQAGIAYDTANPAGGAFTLNAGSYTEIEFNIQANANASQGTSYYFRVTNAGTPLTSYATNDAQITMQVVPGSVREDHYRIGQDSALTSMSWYANTDTAASDIPQNTNLRVRFQVYNSGGASINWTPQLEWSATSGSGYAAVPTTSGAPPFFVADTSQYTNGASIATGNFGLGAGVGSAQAGMAYDTANPAGAAFTLNAGSYTEIEFNIQANANSTPGNTYYFRLTNAGSALTAYEAGDAVITLQATAGVARQAHYRIGQDAALTAMTWYAATDTLATNIPPDTNIRVRFQIYNNGGLNKTWTPQLEWSATSGSGYAAVPTTSGASPFFVADTSQYTNGAAIATGNFGLGAGTGSAQTGVAYDTANPAGASFILNTGAYTEIEFNIQANSNATLGTTYYFRLTDAGTPLNSYDVTEAQLRIQTAGVARDAHYRIGQDSPLDAMTWYAATDTGATDIARNTNLRVRFQIYNDGEQAKVWTPQLEWTATSGSGYAAVPTSSGATPFFISDTALYTNATSIATGNFGLGTGTGSAQAGIAYDTANPAGSTFTINAGSYVEIEFSIQANANAVEGTSYYFRLTNAGTPLTAYQGDGQLTMQVAGNLRQAHYRIGQDAALTSMTWYAAADTQATNIAQSTNLRVRFQVYNNIAGNKTWTPQLEWSATSGSGYAAVPTSSGASPFFVTDTAQYTNATSIATGNFGLGTGTGSAQAGMAYDAANPAGASITLNGNSYTEVEFNIQANANATLGTTYYFRLTDGGTPLTSYDVLEAQLRIQTAGVARVSHYRIGQDTDLTTMAWFAATDTAATDIPRNTNLRVRFQIYNNGEQNKTWTPQLEWSATLGSGYAAVPTTSGAAAFFVSDTTRYTNATAIGTANFGLGAGTGSSLAGMAYDTANPAGASFTLNAGAYTEIEFNIQANANASEGSTYYFRLTDSGTVLTAYEVAAAQLAIQVTTPPQGSQTLNLHSADVQVNGVTFNTANDGALAGTLDTVSAAAPRRVTTLLVDAASISIFASNPVPPGTVWDLSGSWTFRPYVRASTSTQAFVQARVYKIDVNGATTEILSSQSPVFGATTSYALRQWSGTMGAQTLQPGERFGVAFYFNPDDVDATGYIGLDESGTPSNFTANIGTGVVRQDHYRIGQDTALTAMTWYAATDTGATNLPRNTNFRVRFQLYNNGSVGKSWTPQLEWSATSGSGYTAVPTTSGATPFFVTDTTLYTNATLIATGNFGLGTGVGTAQAGVAYDAANPAGGSITLNANSYTEIEFNIQANSNAAEGTTYYFRLTSAGSALAAYEVTEAQITILISGNVREAHYRIGQDSPLASMTWHANTDTAATGIAQDTNFRVRFQVYNNGGVNVNWTPQLEWTVTQGSGHAAVPTSSGAAPFFVTDTAQFTNGASIATGGFGLGTGTGSAQAGMAYDTANPAGGAFTLNANSYTEIEFNIQANANATPGGIYYFRITNTGVALTAYATTDAQITIQATTGVLRQAHYRVGQDSSLTAMTWYAATDTQAAGIPTSTNIRVRFQVYNNGVANIDWTPQLEWTVTQGSGYAAVPTASGAPPFFVVDTAQYTNVTTIATGNFGLGAGTGSAQAGVAYDTANPAGATITLNTNAYTEIEFSIQANANATLGTVYYFRLTNAGTPFTGYDVTDALVRMQTPGVVRQAKYRIGQDSDLTTMTWLAATDTAATGIARSANFRVRFQVHNDGELAVTWTPQLEWTATSGSGYAAVPTTSGAPPFFVNNTLFYTNAATIETANFGLGSGTGAVQAGKAYDSENPAGTGISLNASGYTEIEFNIQANTNAVLGNSYYFRLTNGGTALASYIVTEAQITMQSPCALCSDHYRIGRDDPLASMTWYSSVDTPATSVPPDTNFRIRFQIYNNSTSGSTWTPRFEWSSTSNGTYAAIPTTSGAAPFFISDTSQFTNAAAISAATFHLGTGVGTAQNGVAYDTQNPAGASITLNAASHTEIEFSVRANANASEGATYYFRLTNNGTLLAAYENAPAELVIQTTPPPTPTPANPAHNFHLPYSADTSACAACHRAHTAVTPYAVEKRWPEEEVCYTCHDGTGAPNIKSQFLKTYKMPIAGTSGIHGLIEWRTKSPSSFSGANRHVECTDCHNPHYAGRGNHTVGSAYAGAPQQGIWGVSPSYTAAWAAPSSWTTVNRVTYQYELCFKCHSSWAYGGSPPQSPSGGFAQTDVAKDFNPLNASFMPVLAQGKNPFRKANGTSYASSLIGGFTPTGRMVCSDCHASDNDSDPGGPHGSTNPFLLRGPWDRTTGQTGTSSHLCFKCHDWNVYRGGAGNANATGFSGEKGNLHGIMVGARNKSYNDAPIVCMDCHIAITHGYFRDHLIGFTGDAAPYINRPYSGGLTTINNWAASGEWQFSDCSTAMGNCK